MGTVLIELVIAVLNDFHNILSVNQIIDHRSNSLIFTIGFLKNQTIFLNTSSRI
jgi:hypothetical protein